MLSSFTYVKILAFNPYVVNISFTCMAMVAPKVFIILNKSIVTWPGSQLWFKKWTTKTKVFTIPLDIHKLLELQKWISFWSSQLTLPLCHSLIIALMEKKHEDFASKLTFSGMMLWQDKSTNSLTINRIKSSSNWIWWGSFLL